MKFFTTTSKASRRVVDCVIVGVYERGKLSAGATDIDSYDLYEPGEIGAEAGLAIHEMGTARMGRDPSSSVLNGFNQAHTVANLFVTDGSCMTSSACQNPSLTYMAMAARAANHVVEELKRGAL